MQILLNVVLVLLYCVSIHSSNKKKKNGISNKNININIRNEDLNNKPKNEDISYSYVFSIDGSRKKCDNVLKPAAIYEAIKKTYNSQFTSFNNSPEFNEFPFYDKENEDPKSGKRGYQIKFGNGSLSFDRGNILENVVVLENCIYEILEDQKNNRKGYFSYNEKIVLDLNIKKLFENGYFLQSSNDLWDYGYKDETGYIYSLKPSKFTEDFIKKLSPKSSNTSPGLNIISDNTKELTSIVSDVLLKRYKSLIEYEYEYDYEIEELLNNNVGELLKTICSFPILKDKNYTDTIVKNIKSWIKKNKFIKFVNDSKSGILKIENIAFGELNIDELKEKFKYRFLVEYIKAFDLLCRFGKCEKNIAFKKNFEKEDYIPFLSNIFLKYFYIFDLNCYKDDIAEEFFKKNNLLGEKNELSNIFLSKNTLNMIPDCFKKCVLNPINKNSSYQNIYNYSMFLFKYDSSTNFFLKKSEEVYIRNHPFRYIDSCISGLHFVLTPESEMEDIFIININELNCETLEEMLGLKHKTAENLLTYLKLLNIDKKTEEFQEVNNINSQIEKNKLRMNRENAKKQDKKFLKGENYKLNLVKMLYTAKALDSHLRDTEKNTYIKSSDLDKVKERIGNINSDKLEELKNFIKAISVKRIENIDSQNTFHIKYSMTDNSCGIFFNINNKNENCRKISSFYVTSDGFRFTYQYGNNLQVYNLLGFDNNEFFSDKNEIKENDKNEIKNIMSTLYDFEINTSHNIRDDCYFEYLCEHSFSSVWALFNNGDYNYANLSVCKHVNDKPLIAFKRDKMFVYGRLKKFLHDNIKDKDTLLRNIFSIVSNALYSDNSVVDIISSKYPSGIICDSKYFFINNLDKGHKIFYKYLKDYLDITDDNLNFIIDSSAKFRGSENSFKYRLIYNPDIQILNCDYVIYTDGTIKSFKKKINIFDLLKLADRESILQIDKSLSTVIKNYSKFRNLAKTFINSQNKFEGISKYDFDNLVNDIKQNKELNNKYYKSTFKIINEIKLNEAISYDSLIFFLWMHCNVDVDSIVEGIKEKYKICQENKKNIIFTKSLVSSKNVCIDNGIFLGNIDKFNLIDNIYSSEKYIQELYNDLVLLSLGYRDISNNEALSGNLEGIYHFRLHRKLRLYFTFDKDNVKILNYIGHLSNKEETSQKSMGNK